MKLNHNPTREYAEKLDENDELASFREKFYIPKDPEGNEVKYFTGNSLGLQPKHTEQYIKQELDDWAALGVEGHTDAKNPWMPYHEFVTDSLAKVVGAKPIEVVAMNTLTVNLHLMMVSFYRPEGDRKKIMIERDAFPSDIYAVKSQLKFHGNDPENDLIMLAPREGEFTLRTEDIIDEIKKAGDNLALVMLGGVNYYTGQFFELDKITKAAHDIGAVAGFDLAHAAGNIDLKLHDWNVDFAVWCTYKYLNAGPGGIAGAFVHENHATEKLPRFEGWWGTDKKERFLMKDEFNAIPGVESWQLSNPPIFQLAALRASLDIFMEVGMQKLKEKSRKLTSYLEYMVKSIGKDKIEIITPEDENQRGCQLSIRVKDADKNLFKELSDKHVIADWREPDVIRVAPVPLYNSYMDCYRFATILKELV